MGCRIWACNGHRLLSGMKHLVWVIMLISSCARSPHLSHPATSTYAGVLPTKNNLVFYRSAAPRPGLTPAMADSKSRAWFRSSGRALNAVEQNSIRRKTDLVYLATLPSRRVPADSVRNVQTLPALRFLVTIDNTGDSTRVFATNFESLDRKGSYQPLEKQPYSTQPVWVSMWLNDLDGAVTEMIESLTSLIIRPAKK